MDTKRKGFFTRIDTLDARTLKGVLVVAVIVGLIAGAFPAAVSAAGAARTTHQATVSVDRTNKGDRLPQAVKRASTVSSPAVAPRPPIGCESAFSRVADPAQAHIFGRCIS